MKLEKKILGIAKNMASNKAVRPNLAGVYIDNGNYYASNSFSCIRSRSVPAMGVDTKELFLPTEDLKAFDFKGEVEVNDKVLSDENGVSKTIGRQPPFPNFEQFMSKNGKDLTYATVDIDYLMNTLKTLKACGNALVRISIENPSSAVFIDGAVDGDSITYDNAVIMPIRQLNQ